MAEDEAPAPGPLAVMCSGAFVRALRAILPGFKQQSGRAVRVVEGSSAADGARSLPARLRRGEAADVAILFEPAADALLAEAVLRPGTKLRVATSAIGVAVRAGAAVPDIGAADGVRAALLGAESFAFSASASGEFVRSALLERLNLPAELARKGIQAQGEPVGHVVARGEAALGFQQMSELLGVAGIAVLGPLPAALQQVSVICAAVPHAAADPHGARALMRAMAAKENRDALRDAGLEPLG